MIDREKVIKGIDICLQRFHCGKDCPYYNDAKIGCEEQLREDALALLKDQQQQIWELQDQVEYLTDKLKEQKFLVGSDGKITPLPVVVRCKDCKKRYTVLCIQEEAGNINNQDNWYCADGECK